MRIAAESLGDTEKRSKPVVLLENVAKPFPADRSERRAIGCEGGKDLRPAIRWLEQPTVAGGKSTPQIAR